MINYFLLKYKTADVQNFTSDIGIKLRRIINPCLRKVFRLATKGKVIIDKYPKLNKSEPYIFVPTHAFCEDTIATLSLIDRSAYVLFGTTDQLEHNPLVNAAWLNGLIYIDRTDREHRKSAILKMQRILNSGSSVMVFAEGGLNNTENLLLQKLFASPYILAKSTGCKVVPVAPFYEFGTENIYMNAGEPVDLSQYDNQHEALTVLRDAMATLVWENIENHASQLIRKEMGNDPRAEFMEERRLEYRKNKWTRDVWDEELTRYFDKEDREYIAVQESMDNIIITAKSAKSVVLYLIRREEELKYDFKQYMHKYWK